MSNAKRFFRLIVFCVLPLVASYAGAQEATKSDRVSENSVTSDTVAESVQANFKTIRFPSQDELEITADLYLAEADAPLIILCHQAGWSRGEYREIAPKLNRMGFNCLAIDQRSGGEVNGVANETAQRAKDAGTAATFVDAEQDMLAAIEFARTKLSPGKLVLWGSSYSSALALRIAGERPDLVDGVLAFAPAEYFERFDKPSDWITSSATKITAPTFITSAKKEAMRWFAIYQAVQSRDKAKFVPKTAGNHGSRALWDKFDDSGDYWAAVKKFLDQFKQQ